MFTINPENRTVEITDGLTKAVRVIKEGAMLNRIYAHGTTDKYRCQLVLLDVKNELGVVELVAYAMRLGFPEWLMGFNDEEYTYED